MEERYAGEVLTDNTQFTNCEQCEDCVMWGNIEDDYFSNSFSKSCCDVYPYPQVKPDYVINNTGQCKHRKVE